MELMQIIEKLRQNPQLVQQLASSADGQRLIGRLDAAQLQHATQQGEQGCYGEMAAMLKQVMAAPDGKALLQRLAQQLDS